MSATADILPPFDPTGYASITGAQLYQYLSGAAPYVDTGFNIVTTDSGGIPSVPDAATTSKWQRYLWIRITATSVNAYLWNPSTTSDATYLKWVNVNIAGIGAGAIVGSMIADFTITSAKIISLDYTKLSGVPSTFSPGGAAGGDLTGTYPNPTIGLASVTGSKIAGTTITHANLAAQAVEVGTDIKPNGVGLAIIRTNAGATAAEWADIKITQVANPVGADAYKLVRVNSTGSAFEAVAISGAILQQVSTNTSALISIAAATPGGTIPIDNTIPASNEGTQILSQVITPLNTANILDIEVVVPVANPNTAATNAASLLQDGVCVAAAICTVYPTSPEAKQIIIRCRKTAGTVAASTFTVRVGTTAVTVNVNAQPGSATQLFGGVSTASMTITERTP